MTTNHIEKLDPALIRPGRVDVIHEIGDASPSQIKRLFLNFFPVTSLCLDFCPSPPVFCWQCGVSLT